MGGFDLAAERAGIRVIAMCEIDPACRRVLHHHWPDVPIHTDIKELDGTRLPYTDILYGGFPCTDVSVAGRRAGLAGERSGLFFEFLRLAQETRPSWVVIENVPGLLSSKRGWDYGTVIGSLVDLGYGVAWRVLDAQYFGLAQRRKRVFIVGCLGDRFGLGAREVLSLGEGRDGDTAPSREKGARLARDVAAGVAGGRRISTDAGRRQCVDNDCLRVESTGVGTCGADDNQAQAGHLVPVVVSTLQATGGDRGYRIDAEAAAGGHLIPVYDPAPTITGRYGKGVESDADDALIVLSDSTSLPVAGQMRVRRLLPIECERLQGFPDDHTAITVPAPTKADPNRVKLVSDSARYKQLGNAVAVPVVEWIMRRLVAVDAARRADTESESLAA